MSRTMWIAAALLFALILALMCGVAYTIIVFEPL